VAIGNALALPGGPTVSAGVVSALGRTVQEPGETSGSQGPYLCDLVQTDAPINPGVWRLVYENLSGTDELYRLQFSAGLALASLRFGLPPIPANCSYRSEPADWAAWRADNWQRIREERAKALAQCVDTLVQTKARLW